MGVIFAALVFTSVFDYFTAIVAVIIQGGKLNRAYGIKGMLRKLIAFSLVPFAILIDYAIGSSFGYPVHSLYLAVNVWLITSEGFSVVRNVTNCGVRVPSKLIKALEVYGDETFESYSKRRKKKGETK